jgi:Glyoxalase/Bleomycin resistance protein/Dioxygenase superfamily
LDVQHVNIVHEDYDAVVEHYGRLFGGVVVFDRLQPTWHACLLDVGGVLFEIFVPNEFFLHTRYGPHYLGIEYRVADIDAVRETLAARQVRIARDLGTAVHTHAADCHGVSLEFFDGDFHTDPDLLDVPMPTSSYWRDEHPLGLTGLHGCTVAVSDLASATADFQALLEHQVLYETRRPSVAGIAVGMLVGGAVLELIAPDGDGPLHRHLIEHGEGIRSTVFEVPDLDRVRTYFAERGISLVPGTAPGSLAIPAAHHLDVLVEFVVS